MNPPPTDRSHGIGTGRPRRTTRPRRRHGSLRRDDIVEAALELAAQVGFETINLRALSAKLDCSPMAIYTHVDDKEELLSAMADKAIALIEVPEDQGYWVDWYIDVARSFWTTMRRYPGLETYILTRGPVIATPSSIALTIRMFDVLRRAGFDSGGAAAVWRTAHTYLSGHAMLARSASYDSRPPPPQSRASEFFAALSQPVDEHSLEAGLRHILTGFPM